jgi:hypothetical protein
MEQKTLSKRSHAQSRKSCVYKVTLQLALLLLLTCVFQQPASGQASSDYAQVEVKLRAFIPAPGVDPLDIPILGTRYFYGGDGRGFAYEGGRNRVQHTVKITMDPARDPRISAEDNNQLIVTRRYLDKDKIKVEGAPHWWVNIRNGAIPVEKSQTVRDSEHVEVKQWEGEVYVRITADLGNPFLSGVYPNAQADITVHVMQCNREAFPVFRVKGWHSGFPAWELYINGYPVHLYTPEKNAQGPFSLAKNVIELGRQYVDIGWNHIEQMPDINWLTQKNNVFPGFFQVSRPVQTGIWVEKGQIVNLFTRGIITLGDYAKESGTLGISKPYLEMFTPYNTSRHGALMAAILTPQMLADRDFVGRLILGRSDLGEGLVWGPALSLRYSNNGDAVWSWEAPISGYLVLFVNDTDLSNNHGNYEACVLVVSND